MKKIIKRLLAFFSIRVTVINEKSRLLQMGLHDNNYKKVDDGKKISLADFSLLIDAEKHDYVLKGIGYMYSLKKKYNAQFIINKEGQFIVNINNIAYNIQTTEELYILNEVFINDVYNITMPGQFVLIDIGMNVAITSLYFANNAACTAIYSFEPFRLTFEQALLNISLNPALTAKINPFNFGLGNHQRTIDVLYDKEIKGNMGINGIPQMLNQQDKEVLNDQIEIRNANETLLPIVKSIKDTGNKIVLKVDCEGSEYEIFESFENSTILQSFDVIIIEWHKKGPEPILTGLKNAGYILLGFNPAGETAGMIYAFKK